MALPSCLGPRNDSYLYRPVECHVLFSLSARNPDRVTSSHHRVLQGIGVPLHAESESAEHMSPAACHHSDSGGRDGWLALSSSKILFLS